MVNGIELKAFFQPQYVIDALKCGGEIEITFTIEYDEYSQKQAYIVSNLSLNNSINYDVLYLTNILDKGYAFNSANRISEDKLDKYLSLPSVLLIFDTFVDYLKISEIYDLGGFSINFFALTDCYSKSIIISTSEISCSKLYSKVIQFVREDLSAFCFDNIEYYIIPGCSSQFNNITVDRKVCSKVYLALQQNYYAVDMQNLYEKLRLFDIDYVQFIVCIGIFKELKLILVEREPFYYQLLPSQKTDLSLSKVFRHFCQESSDI